jgi:hypothetical protein
MKPYNGHRSWNAWNVSLWLGNDEGLYNLCIGHLKTARTKDLAARRILRDLQGERTPDGARYNLTSIREAIRDF